MIRSDYAAMPAQQLLRLFAEAAAQMGLGRICRIGGARSGVRSKQEKQHAFADAQTIAGVLRSKATRREIAPLFEADDPDVGLCAALVLGDVAPQLADAATKAAVAGIPMRQAVAEASRARTPPLARPTLQEMDDEALLVRFQDAGERLAACAFIDAIDNPDEFAARDRIVEELAAIRAEFDRRGTLERLAQFLDAKNPRIRFQAALGCLRVAPDKAVAALEALTQNADPATQLSASSVLQRWRAGEGALSQC